MLARKSFCRIAIENVATQSEKGINYFFLISFQKKLCLVTTVPLMDVEKKIIFQFTFDEILMLDILTKRNN